MPERRLQGRIHAVLKKNIVCVQVRYRDLPAPDLVTNRLNNLSSFTSFIPHWPST